MSILQRAMRIAVLLGIAGLGSALAISDARAQGGFGGGFFGGGFGGGGFGGGRGPGFGPGGPRFAGPRPFVARPFCAGGRCGRPKVIVSPCVGGGCRPIWRPRPVIVRTYIPVKRTWYVKRPYYQVRRPYVAPVPFVAPAVARPLSCPAVTNVAANTPEPQFVFVIFQQNATAVDTAGFLKTYTLSVDDGPNQDGYFKLKLASPLTPDRMNEMISSMRTQTNVVSEVAGS